MNEIQIFQNQEFGAIRTMSNEQGEPMFCAKDVALALGYKNPTKAAKIHVDEEDRIMSEMDTIQGYRETIFINESGLYALILSSKLESAKRFKHWVTSEVLPSIRKQGGYMVARPDETDEEILARALQIMKAAIESRDEVIAELLPRADYADEVLDSVSCITTTQLAKELGMTAQELNRRLCEMRIQYWQAVSTCFMPTTSEWASPRAARTSVSLSTAWSSRRCTWCGRSADASSSIVY